MSSGVYYLPRPVSSEDLAIMRRIDALHLEFPFAGSRLIRDFLRQESVTIGRCHVASLMKKMAIEAVHRRPSTFQAGAWAQDPSFSPAQTADRKAQSGLGGRYQLHSHGPALRLSRRHRRSVQPQGSQQSDLDHAGGRLRRGSA
ncbi:transposase [Novosphingobium sp. BW1]|nr:transposase [Novosphingobium sp. BW1]